MRELALVGDVIAVAGFFVAMLVLASTPANAEGPLTRLTKWFMFAAFATRMYVSATKVLVHFVGPSVFEEFADYIEVMFPVLVAMSVFSAFMAQQLGDVRRSQRAVAASSEMMLGLVDAAPAGIMLLDGAGRITFANESARDVLDLFEDAETGGLAMPGVVIRDPSGGTAEDFSYLVGEHGHASVRLSAEWPSGWRVGLSVAVRPLDSDAGRAGGMVATFERPARGL